MNEYSIFAQICVRAVVLSVFGGAVDQAHLQPGRPGDPLRIRSLNQFYDINSNGVYSEACGWDQESSVPCVRSANVAGHNPAAIPARRPTLPPRSHALPFIFHITVITWYYLRSSGGAMPPMPAHRTVLQDSSMLPRNGPGRPTLPRAHQSCGYAQ